MHSNGHKSRHLYIKPKFRTFINNWDYTEFQKHLWLQKHLYTFVVDEQKQRSTLFVTMALLRTLVNFPQKGMFFMVSCHHNSYTHCSRTQFFVQKYKLQKTLLSNTICHFWWFGVKIQSLEFSKLKKIGFLDKKCSFRTVCYLFFSSQSTLYQYSIERSQWKTGQRIGIYQSCRNLEIRARDHQWTKRFRHFSAWHPRENPEFLCQQLLRYSPIVCFSRFPIVGKTQVNSMTRSRRRFLQPVILNFLGLFWDLSIV